MALVYSVFPAEEHVRVVGKGAVTLRDVSAVIKRLLADRLTQPHFSVLADLRALTSDGTTGVHDIVTMLDDLAPAWDGNIAIVAKGALLFTAVLTATQIRAAQPLLNIKVFGDCAGADAFCMKGRLTSLAAAQG